MPYKLNVFNFLGDGNDKRNTDAENNEEEELIQKKHNINESRVEGMGWTKLKFHKKKTCIDFINKFL